MDFEKFLAMIKNDLSEKALDVIKNCTEGQAEEFAACAADSINSCAEEVNFLSDM